MNEIKKAFLINRLNYLKEIVAEGEDIKDILEQINFTADELIAYLEIC